jgi:hypothetical protein
MSKRLFGKLFFAISFLMIGSLFLGGSVALAWNPTFFALNQSPAIPPNVMGLDALEETTTSILLFWTSGGGTTVNYRIAYQSGATAPASCILGTQIAEATVGAATNYIVTGLTANTQYSFRVCAVNIVSDKASGVTVTLRTPVSQPTFRSMGFNSTAAKAVGTSNAMSITGSIATFASAPGVTIGVGDAIQYSAAANATVDTIVFIHGRLSATQYLVKTAAGASPANVASHTSWSLFRAYTSLLNAEAQTENTGILLAVRDFDASTNITSPSVTRYIECYADAVDTSANPIAVTINGWTTSATNKLIFTAPWETRHVGTRQRHMGTWSSSYFTATVTDNNVLEVEISNVVIEGLQLQATAVVGTFMAPVMIGAGVQIPVNTITEVNNNIIEVVTPVAQADVNGIFVNWLNTGLQLYATNNIVICTGGGGKTCIRGIRGSYNNANTLSWTAYVYNNTVVGNWDYGIDFADGGTGVITVFAKNNIVQGSTFQSYQADVWGTGTGYNIAGNSFTTGAASDKASTAVTFVNAASKDYHLGAGDTAAKNAGTDLSADANYPVTTDIDTTARTGTWDIGADSL